MGCRNVNKHWNGEMFDQEVWEYSAAWDGRKVTTHACMSPWLVQQRGNRWMMSKKVRKNKKKERKRKEGEYRDCNWGTSTDRHGNERKGEKNWNRKKERKEEDSCFFWIDGSLFVKLYLFDANVLLIRWMKKRHSHCVQLWYSPSLVRRNKSL